MPDVFGLSERAADRLALLLNEKPGGSGPSGRGRSGARIRFVKCLSATAVGGAGVLTECYPAQIIEPAGDKKLPAETGGLVLLTLIGSDGNPAVPAAGQSYLCVITGDAAGDESGSGSAVIAGRPRAFGIAPPATGGGGGGTITTGLSLLTAIHSIAADNAWHDTTLSIALPGAGDYLIFGRVTVSSRVSALVFGAADTAIRLANSGTEIAGTGCFTALCNTVGVSDTRTVSFCVPYTAGGAGTLTIQGKANSTAGTFDVFALLGTGGGIGSGCSLVYQKFS